MLIIGVVLLAGGLAGAAAYAAARRWPESVEAPRVSTPALTEGIEQRPRLARLLDQRRDPAKLTGLALTAAIGLILGGLVGIGLLLEMIHTHRGLAAWDLSFARFGAAHATSVSTSFLRDVSQLAGYEGVLAIGIAVVIVEWRRIRSFALVGFVVLALGGQFLLAETIKGIVDRQRPDILHLTGFSGSSFPSGHATAAAATFMTVALLVGRRRRTRTKAVLAAVAVGLAVAVASTRVLLGVHWFTDVLAGLLLGWAWFAVCSIAFGGRLMRFGVPAEQATIIAEAVEADQSPDPTDESSSREDEVSREAPPALR